MQSSCSPDGICRLHGSATQHSRFQVIEPYVFGYSTEQRDTCADNNGYSSDRHPIDKTVLKECLNGVRAINIGVLESSNANLREDAWRRSGEPLHFVSI